MFEEEEHARLRSEVPFVDEDGSPFQQVAVALQREVEDRVKQRMPGADECRERLSRRRDEVFLEGDALVFREHGVARSGLAVAVADRGRDVRDFVPSGLPHSDGSPEPPEGFEKERLDVVRLQPPRLRALHVLPDAGDAACVHDVVRDGVFFEEFFDGAPVDAVFDGPRELRADVGPVAVADGFDEEVAQRASFELEFAEDVEDASAEGGSRLSSFSSRLR